MLLEMKGICKDYPQGRGLVRVLKNIDLSIEQGDYLAIMGPSGSGKTTLMNLIGCLDVPSSGVYILDGEDFGMDDYGMEDFSDFDVEDPVMEGAVG